MLLSKRTTEFEIDYRRAKRRGKDLGELKEVVRMLEREEALPPAYRDHALHGEWAGYRECHLEGDWLLIYKVEGRSLILTRTGTHAELFRSWRGRSR
jgi:mRNA interferase YafQ